MIIGTACFPTWRDAYIYYHQYGHGHKDVDAKIERGEITIGKPPSTQMLDKDTLVLCDEGNGCRRYFIDSTGRTSKLKNVWNDEKEKEELPYHHRNLNLSPL
jgi:hypothetical protein